MKKTEGAREMAQRVKVNTAMANGSTLIPVTHLVERKDSLLRVVTLWSFPAGPETYRTPGSLEDGTIWQRGNFIIH